MIMIDDQVLHTVPVLRTVLYMLLHVSSPAGKKTTENRCGASGVIFEKYVLYFTLYA